MMAIWQLESEKNDPKFSTTSQNLSSPLLPQKKKIKNKQTNQPFNLLWKTCVTLYGFPFLKL